MLAGTIASSLFNALGSLLKYTADPQDKLPEITYWLLGSFTSASYQKILIGCPLIVAGIIIIWVVRETASFFWESMGRKCLSNPEKCCMYRRKHCAAQKPTVE